MIICTLGFGMAHWLSLSWRGSEKPLRFADIWIGFATWIHRVICPGSLSTVWTVQPVSTKKKPKLEKKLVINGLMHRFDPVATLGEQEYSIGNFEGAFLPAVFWHAHVRAKAGWPERADAILQKCEAVSGARGLFAEEIDANQNVFLGNTPHLFSHVEYVRAVIAIEQARVRQTANGHQ